MIKVTYTIIFLLCLYNIASARDTSLYRHGQLKNGLTYYIRHTDLEPGKADFYLIQNVGAMMEEENQNGLAHFLEHMAFNGTENFPKGIQTFLKRRGITQFNAYTGQDETVYHINQVPVESQSLVDSCLLILRDWSGFLLLDPTEIDKERGVILEERRLHQDVGSRLHEQTDRYVYNGSKYAIHNTIGLEEVIKNSTPAELQAYYMDFYRPDQQAVVVVGDIDVAHIEQEIHRLFNPIPKRINPKPRLVYEIPDNAEPIYCKAIDKDLQGNSILLIKRHRLAPPASLDEMMRDNLLRKFYTDIIRKYLTLYINEDSPDFIQTMVSVHKLVRNYQALNIMVNPYPGKEREALKELLEELERIRRFAFTQKELQEHINLYLEGLKETEKIQDHLSNDVYVQLYQNNFLEKNPVTTIAEDIALSRKILATLSIEDMKQWMARWDSDHNWVFMMQGNDPDYNFPTSKEISVLLKEVRQAELKPTNREIEAVPLMDFEVNGGRIIKTSALKKFDAEKWVLSNGTTVYFKQVIENKDMISLTGESAGGISLLEAGDLPSASAMRSLMMKSGVYKHSARMLEEIMKNHKIDFNLRLTETGEQLRSGCDSADVETMFQLIYLAIEKPRFDRKDFNEFVYQSKTQFENTPRTVADSIDEVIQSLRLKKSPRNWKVDVKYFDAMNYDKMVSIYKDRFQNASDFTFYLTGDITREAARQLVSRYLGVLTSVYRKEKPIYYDILKQGSLTKDIEANIPGEKYMVNIEFSNHLKLKPIENLAMSLLQKILEDRYMTEIREEHGGAYGIQVSSSSMPIPIPTQSLSVNFQSSLEKGDLMRSLVHRQIKSVIDRGVTEEEVEDLLLLMKKRLSGNSEPGGNSYWTNVLYAYVTTGKDLTSSNNEMKKLIEKIKPQDIQAFARKFFSTADCFDIVVKSEKP